MVKYIDFVSDMIDKLYSTSVDVQHNKLTTRIREKFTAVSDLECGAHAALSINGVIDYWTYQDGYCYLGDIPHGSTAEGDDTKLDINIRRGESTDKYKIDMFSSKPLLYKEEDDYCP